MINFNQFWQERTLREQWLLGIGGIVAIILFFYAVIFAPLNDAASNARETFIQQQNLYAWMQHSAGKISALKREIGGGAPSSSGVTSNNFLSTVQTSLSSANLYKYVRNVTDQDKNAVQVQFNNVPFDTAMTWMDSLWKQYSIQASALKATKTGTVGVVDMQLTLSLSHSP